jgi:hypothetical protein
MKKKRERKCAAARSPTMKDYADMAYVTFLYGNNETEFPKRLHVVPRGCTGSLAIKLKRQRSFVVNVVYVVASTSLVQDGL